jgi:ABC-2 type transport system permease protein
MALRGGAPGGSAPDGDAPGGSAHRGALRQPSVLQLLAPKWRAARRRMGSEGTAFRVAVMSSVGLIFFAIVFGIIYRVLGHFRATPGVGDLLAGKMLALLLLAFLSILLLSNIITALSSFFLARDLELLSAAPVDGLRVYSARFIETIVNSSWMVVLILVPILLAFAVSYGFSLAFLAVTVVALASFLVLPAVVGTALTLVLVNVFPARRARDLLALIALLGAAALILLFRLLRPEQLARPEGFRNLVDFIASLQTPQSPWLPSEWAAQAILAPLGTAGGMDLFPLLLLVSTAAAFFVMGAWLHGRLYSDGLSRSQEGAELQDGEGARQRRPLESWLGALPVTPRSLVAKDIRSFFRDTTQWSQLILLAVLVAVYVYNIKVLPLFSGEEVGFFLVNVVSFLNLGLAGFVLAAIAARFLFPAISLEGRTLWLLRSSPLDLRALLWSKYWVGITPLLVLALALTVGTNMILRVSGFMMVLSVVTIIVMTFAIGSMALGFGALFPKFDTENPAEIPTSFGGLVFMMTAVAYLGVTIALQAWPVYAILRARQDGMVVGGQLTWLVASLAAALLISLVAIFLPLRIAARRIEALE